jgi:hypothetical protein
MIGTPPSARQISADPAQHAKDFSQRYTLEIDVAVSQRMVDLGLDEDAPESDLPIGGRARKLLRTIRFAAGRQ